MITLRYQNYKKFVYRIPLLRMQESNPAKQIRISFVTLILRKPLTRSYNISFLNTEQNVLSFMHSLPKLKVFTFNQQKGNLMFKSKNKKSSIQQETLATLPMKPNKKSSKHHDMFFKNFYSKPIFAKELFSLIFHKTELSAYDWNNLKEEKDTLKEKRADLVFSVPLKKEANITVKIFILLEHKSSYDSRLFTQLLYYQTLLHEQSLRMGKASPIIPVVFYHGKTPWKWAKSFQDDAYRGFLAKIPARSREYMINYKIKLLDANRLEGVLKDKKMKSRGALYLLSKIWDLKLSHSQLKEVLALFGEFSDRKNNDCMANVSDYLKSVFNAGKRFRQLWDAVEKELIEEGIFKRGGYMSALEYIKEREQNKGFRKGCQDRNKTIALNMLKKRLNIKLVSEVTGLSVKEINKLKNGS